MSKRKKRKEMFKHAKILLAMILVVGLILPAYAVNPADSASFITNILCVKRIRTPIAHRLG